MHELDKGVVLQFARVEVAVFNFFVKKNKEVIFFILRSERVCLRAAATKPVLVAAATIASIQSDSLYLKVSSRSCN